MTREDVRRFLDADLWHFDRSAERLRAPRGFVLSDRVEPTAGAAICAAHNEALAHLIRALDDASAELPLLGWWTIAGTGKITDGHTREPGQSIFDASPHIIADVNEPRLAARIAHAHSAPVSSAESAIAHLRAARREFGGPDGWRGPSP